MVIKLNYCAGDIVKGIVTGIKPYGAFITFDDGYSGLVHISEISDDYVEHIEDFMKYNDEVELYVLDVDELNKHLKLSLKHINNSPKKKRRVTFNRHKKKQLDQQRKYFSKLSLEVESLILKEKGEEKMLKVNLEYTNLEVTNYQEKVNEIHKMLHEKTGAGNDFLGWVEYPVEVQEKEINHICKAADEILEKYDTLVVCGIGGSYLGARAAIEMINGLYPTNKVEIVYFGNTFSATYSKQVLDYLKTRNFAVNVISKSGTTTESAIAFRLLRDLLIEKYGKEEANKRIYATTDKERGALKTMANQEGYDSFVIADDIGGRYSVLTPVGLLPIAAAGIDIREVLLGAKKAYLDLKNPSLESNEAYKYAVARHILGQEKQCELFVTYEPQMAMFAEWWKQLFGESEGKDGKGLFPTSVTYSTDLHSLGQFVQDGNKVLFETVVLFNDETDLVVPEDKQNIDGLNYLMGKKVADINNTAALGTTLAHVQDGGVPNIILNASRKDAYAFGYMAYWFMKACGMSAYMLDINPLNQPGVEVYKRKMFELLGKPGYTK